MSLAERIVRWRTCRGLRQVDLARLCKKSTAAVAQWETEVTKPTHDSLDAIVRALGITLSEFWGPLPRAKAS